MQPKTITVLLVEDESITAHVEKRALEKLGYTVEHIVSGEAAVIAARDPDSAYDLILMDIDLGPGMDGTQAAEQILAQQEIPVLFLSSHTEPEIVEKTEKITSYGYVVKNTGTTVLDASIKMALKLFEANQEIAASRRLQDKMVANIGDVIGITDRDGVNRYKSPNIRELFGLDPEELIGLNTLDRVHPDDRDAAEAFLDSIAAQDGASGTIELRYKHGDGSFVWVEVTVANLLYDPDVQGFLGNYHEITDRRHASEQIQRQLSEKETLLKEVHHRIKNNMAQVEGLLSWQADATGSAEVQTALRESISRVQSIRVLYEKLLIGRGYRNVSSKEYLEGLIDALAAVFPYRPTVVVDRVIDDFTLSSRLAVPVGIILNELLTNIFKYAFGNIGTEDGGSISVRLEKTGTRVTLTVQDNGIGISKRFAANVSPGFGLTIVHMLAEQLGGTYTVENDHGTRSVLTFSMDSL